MSQALDVPTVLLSAADYIKEHGWTTGTIADNDGRVCVLGAIAAACGYNIYDPESPNGEHIYEYLWNHVVTNYFSEWLMKHEKTEVDSRFFNKPVELIYRFNDGRAETADQVIAALQAAAGDWGRPNA